ncbi:helix-turn-helix domain-containing protein [Myroides pelagicus]
MTDTPKTQKLISIQFSFNTILYLVGLISMVQLVAHYFSSPVNIVYIALPIFYMYIKQSKQTQVSVKEFLFHVLGSVVIIVEQFFLEDMAFCLFEIAYVLIYTSFIFSIIKKSDYAKTGDIRFNFLTVYTFFLGLNALIKLVYVFTEIYRFKLYFKESFILIGISFFALVLCFITLYLENALSRLSLQIESEESIASALNARNLISTNCILIDTYFEYSTDYLLPSFSLEQLAQHLEKDRNEVSEILNKEMNTSFYQLVAKYRIEHAKQLLVDNCQMTIEAIVEECGFNSKSSFNKYFRLYEGCTPSVYRSLAVA